MCGVRVGFMAQVCASTRGTQAEDTGLHWVTVTAQVGTAETLGWQLGFDEGGSDCKLKDKVLARQAKAHERYEGVLLSFFPTNAPKLLGVPALPLTLGPQLLVLRFQTGI